MNAKQLLVSLGILAMGLSVAQNQPANPQQPANPNNRPAMERRMENRENSPMYVTSQFLGLSPQELALLSGGQKTIAEVAKAQGADVAKLEAALVAGRNKSIDQAVTNNRLTAAQATTFKANSTAIAKAFLAQKLDPANMRGPGGRGGDGKGMHGGQGGRGQGQGQGQGNR